MVASWHVPGRFGDRFERKAHLYFKYMTGLEVY